jgi:hypothetical protein
VRVHELARGFRFAAETLAHLGITREVLVEHLHHEWSFEHGVQRVVDMRHAAAAEPAQDAVAATGRLAHERDLGIWRLARNLAQLRQAPPCTGGS